jgi:hypothetical protein
MVRRCALRSVVTGEFEWPSEMDEVQAHVLEGALGAAGCLACREVDHVGARRALPRLGHQRLEPSLAARDDTLNWK